MTEFDADTNSANCVLCLIEVSIPLATLAPLPLSIMYPHEILHPMPVRYLKRKMTQFESNSEPASKRTQQSTDQMPALLSMENIYPEQHCCLCASLKGKERSKSILFEPLESLEPLDNHQPPTIEYLTTNSQLKAWLDAIPDHRILSPSNGLPQSADPIRPTSCEAESNFFQHQRPANDLDSIAQRAQLTSTALRNMALPESVFAKSVASQSIISTNKAPGTSDNIYLDTLYSHGIILDLSGRKIPEELLPLKSRILQRRGSPELDERAVFAVMDVAEELAYSSEGPMNRILRTPMFPLEYGGLAEGGNTQWNTIALPNNSLCDNKLSAPKPDIYLAYPRGARSPWTVEQNNVVNYPRVKPYSQPAKRNTFPSLSVELKAESSGGVLTTAELQAAGSGSHSVNAMRRLLEEAVTTGFEADLVQDTISFSIVSSHRQAILYLHWYDPKNTRFVMSYLKSYSSFEADSIRGCNNAVKNIIDNAQGPRKLKIGKLLTSLAPLRGSWSTQVTNPSTPNSCFSGDLGARKRDRDLNVE